MLNPPSSYAVCVTDLDNLIDMHFTLLLSFGLSALHAAYITNGIPIIDDQYDTLVARVDPDGVDSITDPAVSKSRKLSLTVLNIFTANDQTHYSVEYSRQDHGKR